MQCPQCGDPNVIIEGLDGGNARAKCQKCGWAEVQDKRGKPMLTEVPHTDKRRVLTENFS